MVALQIEDVKQFMLHLFSKATFDAFWLYEVKVKMATAYVIDGKLNMEFFDQDEKEILEGRTYALWKEQKQIVFSMIRGHKTPETMQLVFMLSPSNTEKMILQNNLPINPSDVRGLFFNIYFKQGKLSCTTGVSLKTFTLEKGLDYLWEDMVQKYLKQKGIEAVVE
ncbi:MAG: DUF5721 family protein [Lachnospiraceae bacterium]|nr:DUF5721 family protein [Lachnospiraceae bacterium]